MTEEPMGEESAEEALSAAVAEAIAEVDPVAVLTSDLQRLQADFQNYRKRIDKERSESSEIVTGLVLAQFLSALDDIDRAEEHGELSGGFKAVADQLTATTTKLGLTKFVETGVTFDPHIHEALMHETSPNVSETQVTKVLRPGYKFKERILRPAQVIVTDPE
ncbi:MAG: nucleotide exchange factor GrpE [Actinomycetes bacterium]